MWLILLKKQNWLNKNNYEQKISELEKKLANHNDDPKYITTPEFNKGTAENFSARLIQANLVTKADIYTKLKSLNQKVNSNKTKHLLVENEINRLQKISSDYFAGRISFWEDGVQNYLVFQPMYRYLKKIENSDCILSWKSKGLSDETIKSPTTRNKSLAPALSYYGVNIIGR